MSSEQSKKNTKTGTRKPRKRVSRPKGLGDSIEQVTKATGIKAVVDKVSEALGVDCGCENRKQWLNDRFTYRNVECMTAKQAQMWKDNRIVRGKISHAQRTIVAELHADIFKHPVEMPCTCSPKEWMRLINDIEDLYNAYLEDNATT